MSTDRLFPSAEPSSVTTLPLSEGPWRSGGSSAGDAMHALELGSWTAVRVTPWTLRVPHAPRFAVWLTVPLPVATLQEDTAWTVSAAVGRTFD